jgi:hypothetical protein
MDLIDNSVDADATRIAVQVRQGGKADAARASSSTCDNGVGMDRATLGQALRLGSDTKRDATPTWASTAWALSPRLHGPIHLRPQPDGEGAGV